MFISNIHSCEIGNPLRNLAELAKLFLGKMLTAFNAPKEAFLPSAQQAFTMIEGVGDQFLDGGTQVEGDTICCQLSPQSRTIRSAIAAAAARSPS